MSNFPTSLQIRLYEKPIGSITRLPGDRYLVTFADDYSNNQSRDILSLGFINAARQIRPPKLTTPGKFPSFFANLLPENELRAYIAERAGISPQDNFALLWVTGNDLPGAVTVVDPEGRTSPPIDVGGPRIAPDPNKTLRFSLAGVQLKFSAIENAYGGLTIPVSSANGRWIVKVPSIHLPGIPENEFAMMTMAKACGIDVPDIRIVDTQSIAGLPIEAERLSGASFATRRFDRNDDGTRVHIEDFCQIFRMQPTRKYEDRNFADIAKIVDRFIGSKALDDFIKRLVFNIAIGNNDMHLKNWSVVYRDPTAPSLAPAYDFLSTKAQVRDNRTGLAIGNAREFNAVTAAQLAYLAIRAEVSPKLVAHAANEMIDNFVDVWQKHRQNTPDFVAKVIDGQLEQVPLLHERLNRRRTLTLPELPAM